MRLKITLKWAAVLIGVLVTAQVSAEEPLSLRTSNDKVSYGIGVEVARNIKASGTKVDPELLIQRLKDEVSGKNPFIPDKDLGRQMPMFMDVAKNIMNHGKLEVVLDLMIKGLKDELSGEKLLIPDRELRRFMTAFQVELKNNQVAQRMATADNQREGKTFLSDWKEALKLMSEGSKWQLFIPPEFAYGDSGHAYGTRGAGRNIGPYETLIFEMELLAIK